MKKNEKLTDIGVYKWITEQWKALWSSRESSPNLPIQADLELTTASATMKPRSTKCFWKEIYANRWENCIGYKNEDNMYMLPTSCNVKIVVTNIELAAKNVKNQPLLTFYHYMKLIQQIRLLRVLVERGTVSEYLITGIPTTIQQL